MDPFDDPDTGKHHDFVWYASSRSVIERGNPFKNGTALWPDYNSLLAVRPEIAAEWDYDKNDNGPEDVMWNSSDTVWWKTELKRPDGMSQTISWDGRINRRTVENQGCPYLSNRRIDPSFNSLAATYPDVAAEWDYEKNGDLIPENVAPGSGQKVWWTKLIPDVNGTMVAVHWKAAIIDRTIKKTGCPYESGHKVLKGVNDLESCRPDIVEWWDYESNLVAPDSIPVASTYNAHWKFDYYDTETGKTFPFRWTDAVCNRTVLGSGCPFLSGKRVFTGFNDLLSHNPDIAKLWEYEKNSSPPETMLYSSGSIVCWKKPYDDPDTGKHFDFTWDSSVKECVDREGADPYTTNRQCWSGYNDLESKFPEIAAQYDIEKNKKRFRTGPSKILFKEHKKAWWTCENGHSWLTYIDSRTTHGTGCPYCRPKYYT